MKTRKFLSLALALIMVFAMIPVASLAENVDGLVNEAAAMRKLDNAWAALDAAEADALAQGMSRTEVINAVYNAALNLNTVDKDSFSDFTKDGFYFTVDGMYCAYNYRLRNELNTDCAPVKEGVVLSKGSGKTENLKDAEHPLLDRLFGVSAGVSDGTGAEAGFVGEDAAGDALLHADEQAADGAAGEGSGVEGTGHDGLQHIGQAGQVEPYYAHSQHDVEQRHEGHQLFAHAADALDAAQQHHGHQHVLCRHR